MSNPGKSDILSGRWVASDVDPDEVGDYNIVNHETAEDDAELYGIRADGRMGSSSAAGHSGHIGCGPSSTTLVPPRLPGTAGTLLRTE